MVRQQRQRTWNSLLLQQSCKNEGGVLVYPYLGVAPRPEGGLACARVGFRASKVPFRAGGYAEAGVRRDPGYANYPRFNGESFSFASALNTSRSVRAGSHLFRKTISLPWVVSTSWRRRLRTALKI